MGMSAVSEVQQQIEEIPTETKSTVSSVCVPALDMASVVSVTPATTACSTPRDVVSTRSSTPRDVVSKGSNSRLDVDSNVSVSQKSSKSTLQDVKDAPSQAPAVEQGLAAGGVRGYHARLWAHGASVIERQIALNILPSEESGDVSSVHSDSEISVTSFENESWKISKSRKPIAEMTSAEKWLNMA